MILHLIWPSDITITWCQCQVWSYLSLCHGTCVAGWRGWGHQAPGAPSHPASPSPTCSAGDVCSAEMVLPVLQLLLPLPLQVSTLKFKLENFKLDVTSSSNLWTWMQLPVTAHISSSNLWTWMQLPDTAHIQSCSASWPLGSSRLAALSCQWTRSRQSLRSAPGRESAG
jgi:hypothetical protein